MSFNMHMFVLTTWSFVGCTETKSALSVGQIRADKMDKIDEID